jgi:hypothetical protein
MSAAKPTTPPPSLHEVYALLEKSVQVNSTLVGLLRGMIDAQVAMHNKLHRVERVTSRTEVRMIKLFKAQGVDVGAHIDVQDDAPREA